MPSYKKPWYQLQAEELYEKVLAEKDKQKAIAIIAWQLHSNYLRTVSED